MMKIKITQRGFLKILRGNTWKLQICPFASNGESEIACGDWCPMFREPEVWKKSDIHLRLCQLTLAAYIEDFEDLRPMAEKNSC